MYKLSEEIPLSRIHPSPWNFNRLTEEEEERLLGNIKAEGVKDKIVLRPYGDGYEILGGEHRINVLKRLGWKSIPLSLIEFREMSDREARRYIVSTNIRGSGKDLIKEAELYYQEYMEAKKEDKTLTELAEEMGMSKSRLSKILSRLNLPQDAKKFISNSNLSAGVVDEFLNVKDPYALSFLERAEKEKWSEKEAREKLKMGVSLDGELVKERSLKESSRSKVYSLTMVERGAVSQRLEVIRQATLGVKEYLNDRGVSDLDKKLDSLTKNTRSIKREMEGTRYFFNPSTRSSEEVRNEFRDWLNEGTKEDREEKIRLLNEESRKLVEYKGTGRPSSPVEIKQDELTILKHGETADGEDGGEVKGEEVEYGAYLRKVIMQKVEGEGSIGDLKIHKYIIYRLSSKFPERGLSIEELREVLREMDESGDIQYNSLYGTVDRAESRE